MHCDKKKIPTKKSSLDTVFTAVILGRIRMKTFLHAGDETRDDRKVPISTIASLIWNIRQEMVYPIDTNFSNDVNPI